MRLCQIREYSKNSLRGRRVKAFMMSVILPSASVFFRLAELCTASVVLYVTGLTPRELFYNSGVLWGIFALLIGGLRVLSVSAVMPVVVRYFSAVVDMEIPCGEPYGRTFSKSLRAVIFMKCVSLLTVMPSAMLFALAVRLMLGGHLMFAVHSAVLGILAFFFRARVMLGLSALPFLVAKYGDVSILRLFFMSLRVMKGAKFRLLRLIIYYTFFMAVPFLFIRLLPEFQSSAALYINICIKEAEYIGGDTLYSRNRKSCDSAMLFSRKGSFKTSFNKAETSAYGNYPKR